MKRYAVAWSPEAKSQLKKIFKFIAANGAPLSAKRYTEAIVDCAEALQDAPRRGVEMCEIRPGLRRTHYKGNVVIFYTVDEERSKVLILGVYYGGQDYESKLR